MFSGMTIDNMLIGAPACNSKLLERGDVVCQIDRTPVTMDDIQPYLHGSDIPSTSVVLTVRKTSGRIIEVPLKRMAISSISDRCKLFELFAACKVHTGKHRRSTSIPHIRLVDFFSLLLFLHICSRHAHPAPASTC
jgi:hypothetical protein